MALVSFLSLAILIGAIAYAFTRLPARVAGENVSEDVHDLRTLLDAADESVMLLGSDGTLLDINLTGTKRFSLSRDQMLGQSFFSFLPDEIAASRRKALATVMKTRQPLAGEDWRHGHCLAWRVHPVLEDDDTEIERAWVFAKDVTEQRQMQAMEAVFQQFDRRLLHHRADSRELALHLCNGLIPLFGLSCAWLGRQEVSRQLVLVAGAGKDVDVLAAKTISAIELDVNDGESNPVLAALSSAEPRFVHDRMPDWALLDPSLVPVGCNLFVALPVYVNDTVFGVLALYGHMDDEAGFLALFENVSTIISHASLAFEAVYDQSQLRLYEQVLASTGTSVFITNPSGHITWVNEAFVRVTGYAREEIVGCLPSVFSSGLHDEEFFRQMWETLLAGQVWRADVVNKRSNGANYHARQTVSPLQRADGSISHFVALLEDVTDEKQAVERLEHLASHDSLTDLPNRLHFHDLLPRTLALSRRCERRCALLFIDLDRFKPINDVHGHAFGDEVLRVVASRLLGTIRQSDSAARVGGDEFAVILPDLSECAEAALVAAKMIEAVNQPIQIGDTIVSVGASIGISVFPDHGDDPDVLAKRADEAMYRAKLEGRSKFCFCDGF